MARDLLITTVLLMVWLIAWPVLAAGPPAQSEIVGSWEGTFQTSASTVQNPITLEIFSNGTMKFDNSPLGPYGYANGKITYQAECPTKGLYFCMAGDIAKTAGGLSLSGDGWYMQIWPDGRKDVYADRYPHRLTKKGGAPSGGFPWTVVVGGLATLAAVATAIALGMRTVGSGKGGKAQGPEPPQYILQLSNDHLELGTDSSRLVATAWQVLATGGLVAAPRAKLSILAPPSAGGLQIAPPTGIGRLESSITAGPQQAAGTFQLTVRGEIDGIAVEAPLQIKVTQEYVVDVF